MNPKPKCVKKICTVCGLDWGLHGDNPTVETCVELLKRELAGRPTVIPQPMPVPYPYPLPRPRDPWHPYPGTSPWRYGPRYGNNHITPQEMF